jgi:hypothetical protein
MTHVLVLKLLRDLRVPLLVVLILLAAFECLWVKITQRITGELVPLLMGLAAAQKIAPIDVERTIFQGPGRVMQTFMGGEDIRLQQAMDIRRSSASGPSAGRPARSPARSTAARWSCSWPSRSGGRRSCSRTWSWTS